MVKDLGPSHSCPVQNASLGNLYTWIPCWAGWDFLSCTVGCNFLPNPPSMPLSIHICQTSIIICRFTLPTTFSSLLYLLCVISDIPCISNFVLASVFWRKQLIIICNLFSVGLVFYTILKVTGGNSQWPILKVYFMGDLGLHRLL